MSFLDLNALPKVLNAKEVAELLRISESHVHELVHRGELEAYRCAVGGRAARQGATRIVTASIDSFLERARLGPRRSA